MNSRTKNNALYLAITAMFSALLVGGQQALALVPNVEVVTLIVALCAYVWGAKTVFLAVQVFILCDVAIWGVHTWVLSYLIHWNTLALAFVLLKRLKLGKIATVAVATAVAVTFTMCFGVLTSAMDTLVGYTGQGFFVDFVQFGKRFVVVYTAGVWFYVTQTACNLVLFAVAFWPLAVVNKRAQLRMFGN